jgi:L-aminopeptidase/D-esterase-like protein
MAGVRVAALAVVNALGDIRDPESGHIIAGARVSKDDPEFVDAAHEIKRGDRAGFNFNTTLAIVATNARLDKIQATRLAQQASIGVAKTISPVWTGSDGDICFALSLGDLAADPMAIRRRGGRSGLAGNRQSSIASARHGGVPGLAD